MTRLPGRSKTVILQNFAMLSMPAFVRESEAKIIPSSRGNTPDAVGHAMGLVRNRLPVRLATATGSGGIRAWRGMSQSESCSDKTLPGIRAAAHLMSGVAG